MPRSLIFQHIRFIPSFLIGILLTGLLSIAPAEASQDDSGQTSSSTPFNIRDLAARSGGQTMLARILRRSSPYLPRRTEPTPPGTAPAAPPAALNGPPEADKLAPLDEKIRALFQRPQAPPELSITAMRKLRRFDDAIERYGQINGLDPNLIRAVIYVESGGDPKAMSNKGARGLMQLMPGTAQDMGVSDAFDPSQNIFGGSRYLRGLMDRFERVELALWAYNAGPESVRHRRLPLETKRYIPEVLRVKSALDAWGL